MNYERLAAEFLRALRGKRSQQAVCRKLGARSNVVHQWERGRSFPAASKALKLASRLGLHVNAALTEFYRVPPPWLATADLFSASGIATLLEDLRGGTSIVELSRYSGKSRFAIARWLAGSS
ncbi:MAG: helix-turn-helix transcriptional regulator, partial [Polyangiaceae bacterium]